MLTKYENNLPAEYKWMHKFTQQQMDKEQPFILNRTSCVRKLTKYESNLPAEYKWMHKLTQQQVEKREIIHC